jgi:hypothetical protein
MPILESQASNRLGCRAGITGVRGQPGLSFHQALADENGDSFRLTAYAPGVWPGMAIGYWPFASGMAGGLESHV